MQGMFECVRTIYTAKVVEETYSLCRIAEGCVVGDGCDEWRVQGYPNYVTGGNERTPTFWEDSESLGLLKSIEVSVLVYQGVGVNMDCYFQPSGGEPEIIEEREEMEERSVAEALNKDEELFEFLMNKGKSNVKLARDFRRGFRLSMDVSQTYGQRKVDCFMSDSPAGSSGISGGSCMLRTSLVVIQDNHVIDVNV